MLINLHTHHPVADPDVLEIESLRPGQQGAARFCSAGLHPWFLAEETLHEDFGWLQQMAHRPEVLAIGESGLDKITQTPWGLQIRAFRESVAVSELAGKPLIIHCVRAQEEVLALKKELRPQQAWIFHGFDKHPQTARMLLDAGCYLSFGKALFHPNSHAGVSLAETPADRFFLETDDAEQPSIVAIYETAALLRNTTVEQLADQVAQTFAAVFLKS